MNEKEFLIERFKQNNINLYPEQVEKFLTYYSYLIETNKKFNLTAITDFNEVVEKHFLDSCLNYNYFKEGASLCDIGSGAGFPAIPIKILRPDLNVTMVDSLNKRVNFLQEIIEKLNLPNTKAIHSRAQELANFVDRECFDYTIARAVAPLNILLELCAPYTKINGEIISLKSVNFDNELKTAQNAIKVLGLELKNIETIILQTESEKITRKIAYFVKKIHTPPCYPRPKNKVNTNPL